MFDIATRNATVRRFFCESWICSRFAEFKCRRVVERASLMRTPMGDNDSPGEYGIAAKSHKAS